MNVFIVFQLPCWRSHALIISHLAWSDTAGVTILELMSAFSSCAKLWPPGWVVQRWLSEPMCLRAWPWSDQWLLQAPHLLPPAPLPPLCLTTSITKPNTLCSATWDCCLDHRVWSQVKVGKLEKSSVWMKLVIQHTHATANAAVIQFLKMYFPHLSCYTQHTNRITYTVVNVVSIRRRVFVYVGATEARLDMSVLALKRL